MTFAYIILKYAQKDYETSLEWYEERSGQAADNFIAAVDDALKLICENPRRWNNKYQNFYEFRLKRYPYTIVYTIEEDSNQILVSSIYHNKRNPKRKYRKT